MSAATVTPFIVNGLTIKPSDQRADQKARAILHVLNPSTMRARFIAAVLGVAATAPLDAGVFFYAMSRDFYDEFGNFTGNPAVLTAVSLLSLAAYWLIGLAWYRRTWPGRVLAVGLYAVLWLVLCANLFNTYHGMLSVFAAQGNAFAPGGAPEGASWREWLSAGMMASVFGVPGLLFIQAKRALERTSALRRVVKECESRLALAECAKAQEASRDDYAVFGQHLENPANSAELVRRILHTGADAMAAAMARIKANEEKTLNDTRASQEQRVAARKVITQLDDMARVLGSVSLAVMLAVGMRPAHATTSAELVAKAPTLQILLDASPSPGTREAFVTTIWPQVETIIRSMPLASTVIISSIGDNTAEPFTARQRIQTKRTPQGNTPDAIVRDARAAMLAFARDRQGSKADRQSELVYGVERAAAEVNPLSDANRLVIVSDLLENSEAARCQDHPTTCTLPKPNFTLPPGTSVTVFGARGSKTLEAQHITAEWARFFTAAGVKQPSFAGQ